MDGVGDEPGRVAAPSVVLAVQGGMRRSGTMGENISTSASECVWMALR